MFPILNSKPFWKGFSFKKKCVLVFYEKNLSGKDPKFLKFWLEIDSNSTQWDLLISTHWARISIHWDSWNIELESGSISFNCWIWRFVLFKLCIEETLGHIFEEFWTAVFCIQTLEIFQDSTEESIEDPFQV